MRKKKKETEVIEKTTKPKMKIKKKLLIALCILVVLGIGAIVTPFLIGAYVKNSTERYIVSPDEAPSLSVDCVIVLGAGLRRDGLPTDMLADRITRGIELVQNGTSEKLLMSGDHGREHYDEVNAMKQVAINKGIPSEQIFMDHAGFSTYETMYRAKEIFGAKKVVIVTQQYHLYRAIYIARALGLEAYGVNADLHVYMGHTRNEAREVLARVKDFFSVMVKPKPTYLGESIPISGNGDETNDKVFS